MNLTILVGNLTRDPEMNYTPAGKAVTKFSMATNAGKDRPADFHNIVVWGNDKEKNMATNCAQFLTKGKKVCVTGRHTTREWEGQDGVKRRTCEVVASNVEFLTPKDKDEPSEN